MAEIIRAPMLIMDHFKDCVAAMRDRERGLQRDARRARKAEPNLRFAWTSPCGFPVLTDYRVSKNRRTEMKDGNGKRITFEYYAASEVTDWNTAKSSAPPNVVHSLDAAHLVRTLAKAHGAGIDRVSIVHDAFGTTPAKMGALSRLLREEFVAMYSEDVLGDTLGRMLGETGAVRPQAPARGTLDLNHLQEARYMFA
jgi:DNA-directed RNA polymerase